MPCGVTATCESATHWILTCCPPCTQWCHSHMWVSYWILTCCQPCALWCHSHMCYKLDFNMLSTLCPVVSQPHVLQTGFWHPVNPKGSPQDGQTLSQDICKPLPRSNFQNQSRSPRPLLNTGMKRNEWTCRLSQAKTTKTFIPVKCTQPLLTCTLMKVKLYMLHKCRNIYNLKRR